MADNHGKQQHDHPETALGEVLREFEKAETDVDETRDRRHRGEAAEAITPNTRAEEEAQEKSEGR
ncbi:hypothetical protein [Streptomyces sp. SID10815]|uniref:hypothetical protein n=1 Tax=Streptomyces sp. SID10815 TaxID=2706027 RepID=UPI0013CCAC69|nr:hypothetical protein [Streptomyces sp. SID10815]NEA48378.1 hypothetical protein [Streptomyces sp. SID10815]